MPTGTIHALGTDLFVVEGEWPCPSAAVYAGDGRLCLLGTGAGRAQRAAIRAIVASFEPVGELVLLSGHGRPREGSNDDLLEELPAARRWHLRPGGGRVDRDSTPSVPVDDYAVLGGSGSVAFGPGMVPGWPFGAGLDVLRVGPPDPGQVVFHAIRSGTLLLTDPEPDQPVPAGIDRDVLTLLESPAIRVVSAGFGPPVDATTGRRRLRSSPGAR